jgi:3',5'-nucleoside bisphosphate phosphatase
MLNDVLKLKIKSANLHIHTRYSDGAFKPKELTNAAKSNNLDIISFTDHDSVEVYKHIPIEHAPVRILPGIEFSSTWENSDVHILGFGIDTSDKQLLDILAWMKSGRHVRAEKMLDKLSAMGIKIPFENVLSFAGDMKLIVRPHIAQALVANNHCRNKQEAFEKFIGNDAPAYVPKPVLSTADVIAFIHAAGGLAVVAHPGKLKSLTFIDDFTLIGIDGLEVLHPDHDEKRVKELKEICLKYNLLQTGGTDYHGDEDSNIYVNPIHPDEEVLRDIQVIWDRYKCSTK